MTHRSRSLVDWVLVRAWVEPDHARPLRVVVRRIDAEGNDAQPEEAFADADGASSFIRTWLAGLVRRWEAGERTAPSNESHQDRDAGE